MRVYCRRLVPLVLGAAMTTGCATARSTDVDALRAENVELRQELDNARQSLGISEGERSALQARVNDLTVQLADQSLAPPAGAVYVENRFDRIEGVETVISPHSITVRVPGDILFDAGKVELKKSAQKTLDEIAMVIKTEYVGNTIRVSGYTDKDPIRRSKWADNLELSSQRAMTVHRYLQKQGIPDHIYSAGHGSTQPQATKAKSRRVEIVVVLME